MCCKSYDLSISTFWNQSGINDIGVSNLTFIKEVENPQAAEEILYSHFQLPFFRVGCL